jgi:hypothetical protein
MMHAAIAEVKAAQVKIVTVRSEDTSRIINYGAESQRQDETVRNAHAPTRQVEELRRRFPNEYKGILRAAARALEPDHSARHQLYELLNCEPEEQH